MKHKSLLIIAAMAIMLGGCKEAPTRAGEALAQEFYKAWGDTAALKQVEAHFHAVEDSLWVPNTGMYLLKAFLESTARDDSTRAIAQLMAYDRDDYAELQAYRILGEPVGQHFSPDTARILLQLIDWSAAMMGKPDYADAAKQEIDREVQDLSFDKQMAIYAVAATPTTLGLELKADRESPEADMQLIDRQIKALEKIYTPEQMQEFRNAYGSN